MAYLIVSVMYVKNVQAFSPGSFQLSSWAGHSNVSLQTLLQTRKPTLPSKHFIRNYFVSFCEDPIIQAVQACRQDKAPSQEDQQVKPRWAHPFEGLQTLQVPSASYKTLPDCLADVLKPLYGCQVLVTQSLLFQWLCISGGVFGQGAVCRCGGTLHFGDFKWRSGSAGSTTPAWDFPFAPGTVPGYPGGLKPATAVGQCWRQGWSRSSIKCL